jgi:pyruvate/2-oxoglutarate/acetoin dehydrogenase E1 component
LRLLRAEGEGNFTFSNAAEIILWYWQVLYRASVQEVPTGDFMLPLGKADVMISGTDITCVAWGAQACFVFQSMFPCIAPLSML